MNFWKILAKQALKMHNFAYKLSSFLAIKVENGMHPKHRLVNYHQFFLDNINSANSVLDIGCGNGSLTFDLAKKASHVTGIDLSEKYLNLAKQKKQLPNIEYILGDATSYVFSDKFDVVILSNVLEHIENRIDFLRKIKPLASKFVIRVPMVDRDWVTLYKKELGIEYRLDKGHFVEYTEESLKEEIGGAGMVVESFFIRFGEIYLVTK